MTRPAYALNHLPPPRSARATCRQCGAPSGGYYLCRNHRHRSRQLNLARSHGDPNAWRAQRLYIIRRLWVNRLWQRYVIGLGNVEVSWFYPSTAVKVHLPPTEWATEPATMPDVDCAAFDDWRQALVIEGANRARS